MGRGPNDVAGGGFQSNDVDSCDLGEIDSAASSQGGVSMNPGLATIVLTAGLATTALAGTVHLNGAGITGLARVPSSGVANAKFRLSQTNFDQSINNNPATVTPASQVTRNWGTVPDLSGKLFEFTLEHVAGTGIKLRMDRTDDTQAAWTLAWGSFTAPTTGPEVGRWTVAGSLEGILPSRAFNLLEIEARAQQTGALADIKDLNFTSSLAALGSLGPDTVVNSTTGYLNPYTGTVTEQGRLYQTIVSDDLDNVNWTLSGKIALTRTGGGDGEGVRMNINFGSGTYTELIPLPSTAGLAGIGLLGIAAPRRRVQPALAR